MNLTWDAIQKVYAADVAPHAAAEQALGLYCP
jgi:hypothetical protein